MHDKRAKSLVQEKEDYLETKAYAGHPIDKRTYKIVMEYILYKSRF